MRRHSREKEEFAQQMELLKRKLEDKVCVSDEDKVSNYFMYLFVCISFSS